MDDLSPNSTIASLISPHLPSGPASSTVTSRPSHPPAQPRNSSLPWNPSSTYSSVQPDWHRPNMGRRRRMDTSSLGLTNVLGHWILFELLRPALEKAFVETGKKGRVIWTSSYGLNTAPKGGIVFETLKQDEEGAVGAGYGRQRLSGQVSQLDSDGNISLLREIQRGKLTLKR